MKILVTGGAGFIGSHVVETALAEGHEVAALDDLSSGKPENLPASVRLYRVDVRNREETRAAFSDFRPDVVSHQAAQASVTVSMRDPGLDAAINVQGGLIVADACIEFGVQRIVFASTGGAIYGEVAEGTRADESHPNAPISPYAIHKLAYEQLLDVYRRQHGLDTVTLRYANVYGPRQDPHGEAGVVAIFFDRALAGQQLRVNARKTEGDPGCVRDYVYVADVARANLAAIEGRLDVSRLNCATGIETTTEDLARTIVDLAHSPSAIGHGPPRIGDLERSVLDPGWFEAKIGPTAGLREGLSRTADWYAQLGDPKTGTR